MATIGQHLRETRQQLDLSPDDVSRDTNIPASIIHALEDDDYSRFDSVIYVKNFLNSYSKFLGLDISDLLRKFGEAESHGPQGIMVIGRKKLENTERPTEQKKSKMPVFLAPLLFGVLAFLVLSIVSVVTKGTLPFFGAKAAKAQSAAVEEPGPKAEQPKITTETPPVVRDNYTDFKGLLSPQSSRIPAEPSAADEIRVQTTYLPAPENPSSQKTLP